MDRKEVKSIADTEVRAHEKRMHKMRKGGVTSEWQDAIGVIS